MVEYKFRIGAKIVAAIECIITGINVLLLLICFCGVVIISFNSNAKASVKGLMDEVTSSEDTGNVVAGGWIAVLIFAILFVIIGAAALKLWRATDAVAVLAQRRLSQAKFWRVVTIVFTVLIAISYLITLRILYLISLLLFRGLCLFVVHKYIEEMEIAKNGGGVQGQGLQKV